MDWISGENYEEIKNAVLVEYFWNEECAACKLLAKEMFFEKLQDRWGDNVVVRKINTDIPENKDYFISSYKKNNPGLIVPYVVIDKRIHLLGYDEIKQNTDYFIQQELKSGGIPIRLSDSKKILDTSPEAVIFLRDLAKTNIDRVEREIMSVRNVGITTSKPRELISSAKKIFLTAETLFEKDDLVNAAQEYKKASSLAEEAYNSLKEDERIYAKNFVDEASGAVWALKQSVERAKKSGENVGEVDEELSRAEYQLKVSLSSFEKGDYIKAISWAKTTLDTTENVKKTFYESRLIQYQKEVYYYSQRVESKQKEMYELMKKANDKKRLADYYKNDTRLYRDWYEVYQTKILQKQKELEDLSMKAKIWKSGIGLILGSMIVFGLFRRIKG
ncbi:MAG: hypothetical protein ACE5K4_07795 [Candidatus Hydrothermarchaeota archaeon]